MSAGGILIGFLNTCLYCAIIILVAFAIVWILNLVFGITPSPEVMKWGKIVVALLCVIAILFWLFSLLGGVSVQRPLLLWGAR